MCSSNLDEPITKLLKMGGIDQLVQYEGLNSLCFACGQVGHREEKCPYTVHLPVGDGGVDDVKKNAKFQGQPGTEAKDAFGPWVLVT